METMPINEEERKGEENLIKDVSKAFAMASAEDPSRERATVAKALGLEEVSSTFSGVADDQGEIAGLKYEDKEDEVKSIVDKLFSRVLQEGISEMKFEGDQLEFVNDVKEAINKRIRSIPEFKDKFAVSMINKFEGSKVVGITIRYRSLPVFPKDK